MNSNANQAAPSAISSEETRQMLHELGMHQIQLEMQNEELYRDNAQLKASLECYSELYDLAPIGYCTISGQGLILKTNLAAATLLGMDRNTLVKQPISRFIKKEDRDIYSMHSQQFFETAEPQAYELQMMKKDGTAFWGHLAVTLAQMTYDNVVCRVVLSDITDSKRAEIMHETSRLRLENIIEATNVGTWEWNVQTGETVFNERWAQIIGYTLSELEPASIKIWEKFVHPDDLKQSEKQLKLHFARKLPCYECECRMKHKDGHWVWVHDRGRIVTRTADGKPLLVLGTHHDITERKQAEYNIKLNNEELQKANAEKDKFFSIIAHDLRSPFQYFLGLTKEMAEEFPHLKKDEMHEIAVGMRDSATNLYRLIESLLQWAVMQQGLMPFNPKTVLLLPIINESLAMVQEPARNKGIKITSNIPDDLKVLADSSMLQSIIRNLVSNATKFTAKGGIINLSAKYAGDNNVEISIKDSGIGMSREMVDNLFRVDVQTKRKGTEGEPSTGLGLLLCKEFVEKQGGCIRVESEAGKGSVFYFSIPCISESETRKMNQATNLKILIVEDDENSEMLLTLDVENFGKEVLKTRTGVEAVAACRNNPDIDLVLMDIAMPEMDGYESTRQIRQFNKDVVIIAQTASALDGDRKKAIAAGCNDYIAKPYNKTSLTALLQKYFK